MFDQLKKNDDIAFLCFLKISINDMLNIFLAFHCSEYNTHC